MTLCAGLAVLGLCIPLPGFSRATVEAAGWVVLQEPIGNSEWRSSRSLSSDHYRLVVGLSGTETRVKMVMLVERPSEPARLTSILEAKCEGTLRCRIGATSIGAIRCAGGWALFEFGDAKLELELRELCQRVSPLFRGPLKEKK